MLILIHRTIRIKRISLESSLVFTTRDSSNHNAESIDLLFLSEVLNNLRELSVSFIPTFLILIDVKGSRAFNKAVDVEESCRARLTEEVTNRWTLLLN